MRREGMLHFLRDLSEVMWLWTDFRTDTQMKLGEIGQMELLEGLQGGNIVEAEIEEEQMRERWMDSADFLQNGRIVVDVYLVIWYAASNGSIFQRHLSGLVSNSALPRCILFWLLNMPFTQLNFPSFFNHFLINYNPPIPHSKRMFAPGGYLSASCQYPQQNQSAMNSEDSSLLGFLKKKTLFKQSPVRYPAKRSRSKSRDSIIRKVTDREPIEFPSQRLNHAHSERQFRLDAAPQNNYAQRDFLPVFHQNKGLKTSTMQNNHLATSKNPEERLDFSNPDRNNKFYNGLLNYASTFQAARVESAQCLQSLSLKLSTEVGNINYRIDQFRNNMSKVLTSELKALREEILRLVDEAFKESERSIREFMKMEEERLASDMLKMRETLEKEYVRVEAMREEINKPQWRKVTGEILATELEKNLEQLVKKSSTMEVGRWEMKNLSGQRMKKLELQLKDLVRLKE